MGVSGEVGKDVVAVSEVKVVGKHRLPLGVIGHKQSKISF